MYTGHVAIAMAARGVRDDLPLWVLVLASQGCDWVEIVVHPITPRSLPDVYSHAYPFVLLAAGLCAAAVWVWKRSAAAAASVALVYLSHPVADLITGIKPMWLGGPSLGLGFIERPALDLAAQAVVCVLGVAVYWRSLPPARRRALLAVTPLVFLLGLQVAVDYSRMAGVRMRRRRREAPAAGPRVLESTSATLALRTTPAGPR